MALGIEHEARKFDAHLTVGRVKTRRNVSKLMESLNSYNGFNFWLRTCNADSPDEE